ncbi:MAG: hypothetical protein RLZZ618_308 [Pseudomonadota bacterium]|jgi:hypothetical protein
MARGSPRRRAAEQAHQNLVQAQRIQAGLQDGSLTHREAAQLQKGPARVSKIAHAAGRDGHISAQEQERIERAQEVQDERIRRERHDGQDRR